jgi:hypothetical protein
MSESDDKREDPGRIAELEAEVARLRERLGESGEGSREATKDAPAPTGEAAPSGDEKPLGQVPRTRIVAVAIVIVVIALVAFAAVFSALRSGFDSLAQKAAKTLVGDAPGSGTGGGSTAPPPPSGPSVPGL